MGGLETLLTQRRIALGLRALIASFVEANQEKVQFTPLPDGTPLQVEADESYFGIEEGGADTFKEAMLTVSPLATKNLTGSCSLDLGFSLVSSDSMLLCAFLPCFVSLCPRWCQEGPSRQPRALQNLDWFEDPRPAAVVGALLQRKRDVRHPPCRKRACTASTTELG